jgi:hypothetical protein
MKTKMKTKLVLSLSALTMIFTACETAEPLPLPLDCMSIENGTAIIDDCGDCHKFTAYNYVTHAVREVNDTTSEALGDNEMFASPNNPMNTLWNANCTDCDGILNGVAVVDSCGDCQGAYIYNMVTHDPNEIVMLGGDTTGASAILTNGQVIILPEDDGNPYWNSCK